jgi:hypothetical protein
LARTKEVMGNQVDRLLSNWIMNFNVIVSTIKNVEFALEDLAAHLLTVPDKIDKIHKKICEKDTCLGPAIGSFLNKSMLDPNFSLPDADENSC